MTSAVATKRRPWGGLWLAVAFVFALQGVLVFWLSDRSVAAVRPPSLTPVVRLSHARPGEELPLEDPTLFVLPHRQSFSGAAWMTIPAVTVRVEPWSESPRWLPLAGDALGMAFEQFVQTNATVPFQTVVMLDPVLAVPPLPPVIPISAPSAVHVEGALSRRRLRSTPELRGWPAAVPLTNSIVQLLVDAPGNVISASLFSRSGSDEADLQALRISRATRFDSIDKTGPGRASNLKPALTVGRLVFEWQSLPPTNAPLIAPIVAPTP